MQYFFWINFKKIMIIFYYFFNSKMRSKKATKWVIFFKTKPSYIRISRLYRIPVAGLFPAVRKQRMLPLEVPRCGDYAAPAVPWIAECRLLGGSLDARVDNRLFKSLNMKSPLHREHGPPPVLIGSYNCRDVGRTYLTAHGQRAWQAYHHLLCEWHLLCGCYYRFQFFVDTDRALKCIPLTRVEGIFISHDKRESPRTT